MKRLLCSLLLTMMLSPVWGATEGEVAPELMPTTPSEAIPFKKNETQTETSLGRALTITVILLGVAGAGLYFARRYTSNLPANLSLNRNARRRVRVMETVRLNPKASLFLVQFDDRELLLAQSGDQLTLVTESKSVVSSHDVKDMVRDA